MSDAQDIYIKAALNVCGHHPALDLDYFDPEYLYRRYIREYSQMFNTSIDNAKARAENDYEGFLTDLFEGRLERIESEDTLKEVLARALNPELGTDEDESLKRAIAEIEAEERAKRQKAKSSKSQDNSNTDSQQNQKSQSYQVPGDEPAVSSKTYDDSVPPEALSSDDGLDQLDKLLNDSDNLDS